MKRTIAVILAAASLLLCACTAAPQKATVSMFDLSEAMRAAHKGETELSYASSSDSDAEAEFAHLSDLDYSKVGSFFLLYASDGSASTDEIAVIAVKDAADVKAAAESLRAHVEKRRSLYASYAPQLVPALDSARVFTEAQYAVLVVSANEADVSRAFKDFINK